ncbi:hypothetical protein AVEN_120235-1 [Araneus ventricosus]|uniref:Uncharacterized protein n=1 Tax=Araneus ventricosus TaxID=182803 RepID=A0A4Y2RPJ1_ARAVE|nr:hypothetical protein AVEN_120235-1 [Araneus ventricosus]
MFEKEEWYSSRMEPGNLKQQSRDVESKNDTQQDEIQRSIVTQSRGVLNEEWYFQQDGTKGIRQQSEMFETKNENFQQDGTKEIKWQAGDV